MNNTLMKMQKRLRLLSDTCHWYLLGKSQLLKTEPFLSKPVAGQPPTDLDQKKQRYYEDGVVILDEHFRTKEECRVFIEQVKKDFTEAIDIYNSTSPGAKAINQFDQAGRDWYISAGEGIIQLIHQDLEHPLYRTVFGEERYQTRIDQHVRSIKDLYKDYPLVYDIVRNSSLTELASYANKSPRPIVVKIERKTHTRGSGFNTEYVHYDTNVSTVKAYMYLNDVDERTGALAVSYGSHHWNVYPKLLTDIKLRKRKGFNLKEMTRYGIPAFEKVCLPAGSLFCFTGNVLHCATDVEEGHERWTIQVYYYTNQSWSSDKALSRSNSF